jgi:hypothetical protein
MSLLDCVLDDGGVDPFRFMQHIRRKRERDRLIIDSLDLMTRANLPDDEDRYFTSAPKPRTRAPRVVYGRKDSENGPLVIIPPEELLWYKMYVSNYYILESSRFQKKFRSRFRLHYQNFKELVEGVSPHPLFDRWCGNMRNNKKSSPVELLLLGSLRYLGRSWTFDDIEECTAVLRKVHRVFFHRFIEFGSTELIHKMVTTPISVDDAMFHMAKYKLAGLPGCVGSIDCTHIVTERCKYNLKNNHLAFKSSNTTRTYNLTCNHRRRILHSTTGGPGRWNDQTMVRLDKFISNIPEGGPFRDLSFELFGVC